ncbi:hypothetical protein [Enteroscipio rubneri]|nr:hypothetical protein [Enteroscipio rubneri]
MLEDGYYHKTMTKSFMLISAGMGVGRAYLSGRVAAKRVCGVTN